MKFMDKKEEVLDLQLTPWGEYLLSRGKFNPAYYSFHDENILYDSRYAASGKGQATDAQIEVSATPTKEIQTRIQDETPQPRTQAVFKSSETYDTSVSTEIVWGSFGGSAPVGPGAGQPLVTSVPTLITEQEKTSTLISTPQKVPYYSMPNVIGKTDNLSRENASWRIHYLNNELTGSSVATTTTAHPTTKIPQLSSSIEYTISIIDDPKYKSDFELAVEFPDGKILDIKPDYLLLSVEEDNTRYVNDKFEIEVFEVEDVDTGEYVDYDNATKNRVEERLRRIFFTKQVEKVKNNILLDDLEIDELSKDASGDYPSDYLVNTYFDILVDDQIEESILRKSLDVMESKGFYVDIGLSDIDTTEISLVDIYDTDSAYTEVCPVLDECDDGV